MTQARLQKCFFWGFCFFSIICAPDVFADKGGSKDLSDYQAKIIKAVKDTTKNNPPKAQSNYDTKTFLKDKGNFKAQAFCIEWENFIPKALSGDKNLEIKSIGNAWNWSNKLAATGAAVRFCKKRLGRGNNWNKKSEIKTSCECEVLHVNGNFFLSQNANTVLSDYLSTLANEANNSEKKPNQIAKAAEPPVKTTQRANNIATTVETLTNQKPLTLSQAEPPAPQATQATVITKSVAKEFYADVVAFVKTKPDVDIVKFAELYNSRPSIESDWGDSEINRFNQIKLEMLKEAPFKIFFDTQTEKRNLEKAKARAGLEQSLNKKLASLDTLLAESFGSADGDKALALIKKGKALKSQLSSKTNDEIQVFVGEAEALLTASKRKQDFKSKITSINEKLENVVAENFGTDKGNQALAFIQENKAALANLASTANEKFNELVQKSQALISTGANVSDQPTNTLNPTDSPVTSVGTGSSAPRNWKDLVEFEHIENGISGIKLESQEGQKIYAALDPINRADIEKFARKCFDEINGVEQRCRTWDESLKNSLWTANQAYQYTYVRSAEYRKKREEADSKEYGNKLKDEQQRREKERIKKNRLIRKLTTFELKGQTWGLPNNDDNKFYQRAKKCVDDSEGCEEFRSLKTKYIESILAAEARAKESQERAREAKIAEEQRKLAPLKAARDKSGRNGISFNIHKSELKSRGFQCIEEFGYAPTCSLGLGTPESVTVWVADGFVDRIVGLSEKYTQTGFDRVKDKLNEKYELIVRPTQEEWEKVLYGQGQANFYFENKANDKAPKYILLTTEGKYTRVHYVSTHHFAKIMEKKKSKAKKLDDL